MHPPIFGMCLSNGELTEENFQIHVPLTVLEIRKKSRLSLWQMLENIAPDVGCPDEDLVVLNNWRLKGKNSRQMQSFSHQIAKSNRARLKVFKIISRNLFQK